MGGELGGPAISKYLSAVFLIILWFIYIIMSIVQVMKGNSAEDVSGASKIASSTL